MTLATSPSNLTHPTVRRTSIRVALAATAAVALAYLVVAMAVLVIVERNLTDQVDARITSSFVRVPHDRPGDGGPYEAPAAERLGGAPLILWEVHSDGKVETATSDAILPAAYATVSQPTTATIGGVDMRIAGQEVGDDVIVIGQSLEPVAETRATVVLAEIIIAPLLLGIVFLGAVAIGRRVAAPIEQSRKRQLDFTADASHELRTPLAVIEAHTSLALAHDRDAAWYRSAFGRVDRESKRMRRLLDDLLWLARFDALKRAPNAEPVDIAVMAAQAIDRFGAIAETRRLRIAIHAPSGSTVIAAPPEWLDRLMGVLLDNACKYAPEAGQIDVTVAVDGSRVSLTVDDSGEGIPEDQRSRIFDRFHRATDSHGGAGLGLAIADAIVRATGGRWKVSSAPAGGARMSVTWARALA
ncbi:MAG TPA: HAMP domain-containing sensor histidine kinase [Candidatus Limnocylindrales bacterium]|nr:HAMP domain-containing sensor histidine kinase [Candidatus Limnocylindrales bacterium]